MIARIRHSRRLPALVLIAATLVVTGCATVRSSPVATRTKGESQGLTYYLPLRYMKLTATRTQVKIDDMRKALTAKQTLAGEAKKALAAAKSGREEAEAVLANLAATAPADARAQAERDKALALAKEAAAKKSSEGLDEDVKRLQAGVDAVAVSGADCSYDAKIELLAAQPDPNKRYIARLVHNPFRDDTLALTVGSNGLLSSGNVVAVDRFPDIVVEAAGAIRGLASQGSSLSSPLGGGVKPVESACATLPKTFIQLFDPSDAAGVTRLNAALFDAKYPFMVTPVHLAKEDSAPPSVGSTYGGLADGAIFYRTPAPMLVSLEQAKTAPCAANDVVCAWQPVDTAIVLLPQVGPVSYIPMNSSAFVKTVNDVKFADGVLVSWSAERQSEVLEIVRLPVKVGKAIISIPAQMLALRLDISSKDKALGEAEIARIKTNQGLNLLNECLEKAAGEVVAIQACVN